MRNVIIDFTDLCCCENIFAGYTGEHNATELLLVVSEEMINKSDYQTVLIQSGIKVFKIDVTSEDADASCYRSGNTIHFKLDKTFTRCSNLFIQVEFYKNNRAGKVILISKTHVVTNVFLKPSPEVFNLEAEGLGYSCECVQSDHNQNDPTQPDYIKNRLAYRARKFEDIEAVEYPEPILGFVTMDGETRPALIKIAEIPENATVIELLEEFVGVGIMGEEMRLDDPEMLPPEYLIYLKRDEVFNDDGQLVGGVVMLDGSPFMTIVTVDDVNIVYTYRVEIGEDVYEETFPIYVAQKGIYAPIMDWETDDDGNVVYYHFDKFLFRNVKPIDIDLLPPSVLTPSIEVDYQPERDSDNAISSGAVYSLKITLEQLLSDKMDKITFIPQEEGFVLGVVNGRIGTINVGTAEGSSF